MLGGCRDFEVFSLELADGGNHCCGAAGEDFGDVAVCHAFTPLGEGDGALFDGHTAVLGELNQRGAGHAFEDGAGQFGGNDLVFLAEDEEHVHAAELFDGVAAVRVLEDDLLAAVLFAFGLSDHGCRVVTAALCCTGAAFACAGVGGGEPDVHGFGGAEVVTCGRADDVVLHVACGANAQERLGCDHERAEVEGFTVAGGYPLLIHLHEFAQGFDEGLFGQFGQGETVCRVRETCRVLLGAEGPYGAVGVAVALDAFEDFLTVVEDGCCGVENERAVGVNSCVVPGAAGLVVAFPVDGDHVVAEVVAESGVCEDFGAAFGGGG